MQNAADRTSFRSDDRSDKHTAIISNLGYLAEQVAATMRLIESVIAREASADRPDMATNIVVLDDVTPRYVRANAALGACQAGLGVALQLMHDIGNSRQEMPGPDGRRCA
jgi:hypothetical protein